MFDKLKKRALAILPEFLYPNQRAYNETRRMISESESYSLNKLEEFQFSRLIKIVNYAWDNVPGYRKYWSEYGFSPEKLKSLKDIKLIPIISKEIIQNDLKSFTNLNLKGLYKVSTGGSTGTPFFFYNTKKQRAIEEGFILDHWSKFYKDVNRKTLRTVLRGNIVDSTLQFDPSGNLIISSKGLNTDKVIKIIELIDQAKTPIFHVYPSSLYILCKIMLRNNINRPKHKFEAIFLGSEPLYKFQIDTINQIFEEKLCYWYGSTEKVVLGGNCLHNKAFHLYPQYGITELLKQDMSKADLDEVGEIVGTSFWNYATPLIRYKTKDYAVQGRDQYCQSCGRQYQLLEKVEGRVQEFVVNKREELTSMTCIAAMHSKVFEKIKQFRFEQEIVGNLRFLYISDNMDEDTLKQLKSELYRVLGKSFDIELVQVDQIEYTQAGKMTYLNQKINLDKYIS